MKTMNFKHLDTSAYKYFWEELKKIKGDVQEEDA